ncbi:MAG: RICIN domain-containing protein [Clostridia bacterium]|nr:RICIN domain-containing protein [Clostridia bacterium]
MKRVIKNVVCVSLVLIMLFAGFAGFDFSAEAKAESQRDAIVRIALAEEGVSGCPNKYTYAYGEIGGNYDWGWCAAFIYWCSQQAGIPHSIIARNAEPYLDSFKLENCYDYSATADIKKGDILYMLNNAGSHVGLVADVDNEFIYTIEGNVKNTVAGYQYRRSDGYADWSDTRGNWQRIVRYGVPAYEDMKEEPASEIKPADGIYKISSSYRDANREDYDFINFSKDKNNVHVRTSLDGIRDSERVKCQYFNLAHVADGWYTITNIGTGNAMEVADGRTAPGTNIQHSALTGSDSQLFKFYDAGDGFCYIRSKTGCFVDIQSEDNTVNDNVWTYRFNGSPTQKWKLHSHAHTSTSEVTKKATCTEAGIITYNCSGCRLVYSEEIPVTEHNFAGGVCTVCGFENGEKTIPGDVDGDKHITASDARIVLRNAVGLEELDAKLIKNADVDKNDKITASDARLILRAAVGLEDPAKWL